MSGIAQNATESIELQMERCWANRKNYGGWSIQMSLQMNISSPETGLF